MGTWIIQSEKTHFSTVPLDRGHCFLDTIIPCNTSHNAISRRLVTIRIVYLNARIFSHVAPRSFSLWMFDLSPSDTILSLRQTLRLTKQTSTTTGDITLSLPFPPFPTEVVTIQNHLVGAIYGSDAVSNPFMHTHRLLPRPAVDVAHNLKFPTFSADSTLSLTTQPPIAVTTLLAPHHTKTTVTALARPVCTSPTLTHPIPQGRLLTATTPTKKAAGASSTETRFNLLNQHQDPTPQIASDLS